MKLNSHRPEGTRHQPLASLLTNCFWGQGSSESRALMLIRESRLRPTSILSRPAGWNSPRTASCALRGHTDVHGGLPDEHSDTQTQGASPSWDEVGEFWGVVLPGDRVPTRRGKLDVTTSGKREGTPPPTNQTRTESQSGPATGKPRRPSGGSLRPSGHPKTGLSGLAHRPARWWA